MEATEVRLAIATRIRVQTMAIDSVCSVQIQLRRWPRDCKPLLASYFVVSTRVHGGEAIAIATPQGIGSGTLTSHNYGICWAADLESILSNALANWKQLNRPSGT